MQKLFFIFFLITFIAPAYSQKDILTAKTRAELVRNLDSAMRSHYFIDSVEAEKIFGKPAQIRDSSYKFSSGVLRYSFDYVVTYVDSTSKGRLYFDFQQYKDTAIAKSNYQFFKTENQKDNGIIPLKEIGDEAFLKKDNLNQPFIIIIKNNKIFKLRLIYLVTENSLNELIKISKQVADLH